MTGRPPRVPRADTREVAELKQIKTNHPELGAAVDMQIELVEAQRRVQARVPLPWIQPDPLWLEARRRDGGAAVRFEDIPLDWSDFRLSLRQTADILHRYEALERADHERILALSRDGNALQPLVTRWYTSTARHDAGAGQAAGTKEHTHTGLDHVLILALRPFLARSAEALLVKTDFSAWQYGHCPLCGWEPDFAVITPSADRRLICGRCVTQWSFDSIACPYCGNGNRGRVTSFATRDGQYRVYGCDECKRYLKAYDGRNASRPVMIAVDTIATLPLDAAAMQRGYTA